MDHTRDNPLKRFTAFWVALLMVATFGIACVILRPMTHGDVDTAYEAASEKRLETKVEIQKAQTASLKVEALDKAFATQAKTLNQAPTPGSKPLPGAAAKSSGATN